MEIQRPKVTQMVLDVIANKLDQQNVKGFKKYGKTIDNAGDIYNWNQMAMEELADCVQYLMKENIRLKGLHQVQKVNFLHNLEVMLEDCKNERKMCGLIGDRVMEDRFHQGAVLLSHVIKLYGECFQ